MFDCVRIIYRFYSKISRCGRDLRIAEYGEKKIGDAIIVWTATLYGTATINLKILM